MFLHSNETRPSRICCSDHLKVVALRLTEEKTELYKYIFLALKKNKFDSFLQQLVLQYRPIFCGIISINRSNFENVGVTHILWELSYETWRRQ